MCDLWNSEEDGRPPGARGIRGCKPFPLPSHAGNELNQESELITTELSLQTLTLEWLAGASRTHSVSVHPSSDSVGLGWSLRIFQLVLRLLLHMWKTQPLCERTAWLESVTLVAPSSHKCISGAI